MFMLTLKEKQPYLTSKHCCSYFVYIFHINLCISHEVGILFPIVTF